MERGRRDARRRIRTAVVALSVLSASAMATGNAVAATTPIQTTNASVASTVTALSAPIVGLAATPTGKGYWRVAADGGVFTAGDAQFYGSIPGPPHDTIVAIAATPTGPGSWPADRTGAALRYGAAAFHRSPGGHPLQP